MVLARSACCFASWSEGMISYRTKTVLLFNLRFKLHFGNAIRVLVIPSALSATIESLPVFWMILSPFLRSLREIGFCYCACGVFVWHRFFSETIITLPQRKSSKIVKLLKPHHVRA